MRGKVAKEVNLYCNCNLRKQFWICANRWYWGDTVLPATNTLSTCEHECWNALFNFQTKNTRTPQNNQRHYHCMDKPLVPLWLKCPGKPLDFAGSFGFHSSSIVIPWTQCTGTNFPLSPLNLANGARKCCWSIVSPQGWITFCSVR